MPSTAALSKSAKAVPFVMVLVLSVRSGCELCVRVAAGGGIARVKFGFAGSNLDVGRSTETLASLTILADAGGDISGVGILGGSAEIGLLKLDFCFDRRLPIIELRGRETATPICEVSMFW